MSEVKTSREALSRREEGLSPLLPLPIPAHPTHAAGPLWSAEQMHDYARANMEPLIAENERLRAEVDQWCRQARYETDVAADAIARAERLAEALRELEEREQRDEALLRQALGRAHQTAMEQTLKARIPECAEFAGIAQDLDFVVAALRERLGVKA